MWATFAFRLVLTEKRVAAENVVPFKRRAGRTGVWIAGLIIARHPTRVVRRRQPQSAVTMIVVTQSVVMESVVRKVI